MARWHLSHLAGPVCRSIQRGPGGAIVAVVPAGKDVGKANDLALGIGVDRRVFGIQDQRAIRPHAVEPQGEELLDLTGVVFVRNTPDRLVRFVVAEHVEIPAHRRREGGGLKYRPEASKGVVRQLVVEVRQRFRPIIEWPLRGDDVDLAQGIGDALAELIVSGD